MITYEKVNTLTAEEVKNITFENTSYSASLVSHIATIDKIAKALTKEVEKHKDIIKEHENDLLNNKLVRVEHVDTEYFSKSAFIAEYGEQEYKRFCVVQDRKTVKFG